MQHIHINYVQHIHINYNTCINVLNIQRDSKRWTQFLKSVFQN